MTAAEIQFHSERLNVNLTPEILAKPIAIVRETVEVDGGSEEFWGQMVAAPADFKELAPNVITKGDIVARAKDRNEYRALAYECRDIAPQCNDWSDFLRLSHFNTWPVYRLPQKPHPVSYWDPFKETA